MGVSLGGCARNVPCSDSPKLALLRSKSQGRIHTSQTIASLTRARVRLATLVAA